MRIKLYNVYLCVLFLKGKFHEISQEHFPVRLNSFQQGIKEITGRTVIYVIVNNFTAYRSIFYIDFQRMFWQAVSFTVSKIHQNALQFYIVMAKLR